MRILFDQGVPAPLRRVLSGHEVSTAYERQWAELTNGLLLSRHPHHDRQRYSLSAELISTAPRDCRPANDRLVTHLPKRGSDHCSN